MKPTKTKTALKKEKQRISGKFFKNSGFALLGLLLLSLVVSCKELADSALDEVGDSPQGQVPSALKAPGGMFGKNPMPQADREKHYGADKVQMNFSSLSIAAGKPKTLKLKDIDGREIAFTYGAGSTTSLFNFDRQGTTDSLKITARGPIGELRLPIYISSPVKETKYVKLYAYNPFYMNIGEGGERLLIRYTNNYVWLYNDDESGGREDVTFLHPRTPGYNANRIEDGKDDWYALGSLIVNSYSWTRFKQHPMIMVKDQNNRLVARPDDYTLLWNDSGSGGKHDGSLWLPNCPSGFKALGIVASGRYNPQPSRDAIRCVANKFVGQAEKGSKVYNDRGTGARRSVEVQTIALKRAPTIAENKAPLLVGTFTTNHSAADAVTNFLIIPKRVANKSENAVEPRLTDYKKYDGYAKFFAGVRLPFSMIGSLMQDPKKVPDYIADSPFIYLQREERYNSLSAINNRAASKATTLDYTTQSSFSQSDSKKFTTSVGLSITSGGQASFMGIGASYSISISTQFSWENQRSRTFGNLESRKLGVTASPGKYVEVLQIQTTFSALDEDGRRIGGSEPLVGGGDDFLILEFPSN